MAGECSSSVWNMACCIWNGALSRFNRTAVLMTHDRFVIRFGLSSAIRPKRLVRQLAFETARASACIRSQCEKVVNCILAHRGQQLLTYSRACVKRRLCCSADLPLHCFVWFSMLAISDHRIGHRAGPTGCTCLSAVFMATRERQKLIICTFMSRHRCSDVLLIHRVNSILAVGHHIYQL